MPTGFHAIVKHVTVENYLCFVCTVWQEKLQVLCKQSEPNEWWILHGFIVYGFCTVWHKNVQVEIGTAVIRIKTSYT